MTSKAATRAMAAGERRRRRRRRLARRILVAIAAATALVALAWGWQQTRARPTIPIGSALPDFTLVDETGRPVTRASLAAHAVVFSCTFLHDAMHAPASLSEVRSLADELRRRGVQAHLVTVTIDPEEDSADHLPAAASALGVMAPWSLVTGGEAAVTALLDALDVDWKRLRAERARYGTPIFAEDRIFLVDGSGRVRGDYDTTSWMGMRRLRAELERVASSE